MHDCAVIGAGLVMLMATDIMRGGPDLAVGKTRIAGRSRSHSRHRVDARALRKKQIAALLIEAAGR
jgi:hypothetical protein